MKSKFLNIFSRTSVTSGTPWPKKEDILKQAVEYFNVAALDCEIIFDHRKLDLAKYPFALLIFHAPWSGPSLITVKRTLDKLKDYDTSNLKIFILDIDFISDSFKKRILGKLPNGDGETAWLEYGRVKAKSMTPPRFDVFFEFIQRNLKLNTRSE